MKPLSINTEVSEIIESRLQSDQPVLLNWVVQQFVKNHGHIFGNDKYIYEAALRVQVKSVAKRVIKKFDVDDNAEDDQLLPGFEYLRKAYSISRNGEQVLVPIEKCSIQELEDRAHEIQRSIDGQKKHVEEMFHYIANRRVTETVMEELEQSEDETDGAA